MFRELADNQTVLLADIGGGRTDIVLGSGAGKRRMDAKPSDGCGAIGAGTGKCGRHNRLANHRQEGAAALEAGLSRMPKRLDWAAFGLNKAQRI